MNSNTENENENNTYTSLVKNFERSIFDSSSMDIGIDYAELGIDTFITNDVVKEIPILKSIAAVAKIGYNLHERNLYNQTLVFLNEFNNNLNSDKVKSHREKLNNNPKKLHDELGRVLIILNRNIDLEKSKILAKLYSEYINEQYNWDVFCELSDITDKLFITDIKCLKQVFNNNGVRENDEITYNHDRLISIGLLSNDQRSGGMIWHQIEVEALSGIQSSNVDNHIVVRITKSGHIVGNADFKS